MNIHALLLLLIHQHVGKLEECEMIDAKKLMML